MIREQYRAEIAGPDDGKVLLNFIEVLGSQPVLRLLLPVRCQLDMLPEGMASLHQILLQNELCVKLKADFAIAVMAKGMSLVHTPSPTSL